MEKRILAIGSHPDDVDGGCFGTLKRFRNRGFQIFYLVLTYGEDAGNPMVRKEEQLEAASKVNACVEFGGLPSALLANNSGRPVIEKIENCLKKIKPNIIFTHTANDRHQDHVLVNKATLSACRFFQGQLYFYEGFSSLKYFNPTVLFRIDEFFPDKLKVLSLFESQASKFYFNPQLVESLAIFRAAQFGFLGKGEAFEVGAIVK